MNQTLLARMPEATSTKEELPIRVSPSGWHGSRQKRALISVADVDRAGAAATTGRSSTLRPMPGSGGDLVQQFGRRLRDLRED
jgi:hypothetical protein